MQRDLLNDNSRSGPAKFNSIIFGKNHLLVFYVFVIIKHLKSNKLMLKVTVSRQKCVRHILPFTAFSLLPTICFATKAAMLVL